VLALIVASVVSTPLGARLLLSLGTAELNRAAFSERIDKDDRAAAAERAVALLRAASSRDENDPTVQRNLALALVASGDNRRARAAADRAKRLTALTDRAELFQLGRAYVAIGAWGEAINAWQAAEAGPQLLQLGNRLIRARNWDQAINAFIATARLDPDSQGAYTGIVEVTRAREMEAEDAIEELGPLLEPGSPTEYKARLEAARVYREAGRVQAATEELARAGAIRQGPDHAFEVGRLLMQLGQADAAEPQFRHAVRDWPLEPDAWLWLARSQSERGQHEQAVATIREGLSHVDPSGQFAPPAERLPATAAVRAITIKRSERALLLGVLGESLIALGRPAEALPALDEAVAAQPGDPWLEATRNRAQAALNGPDRR
jgi:tetratricopeptide (TPR) repeat protein